MNNINYSLLNKLCDGKIAYIKAFDSTHIGLAPDLITSVNAEFNSPVVTSNRELIFWHIEAGVTNQGHARIDYLTLRQSLILSTFTFHFDRTALKTLRSCVREDIRFKPHLDVFLGKNIYSKLHPAECFVDSSDIRNFVIGYVARAGGSILVNPNGTPIIFHSKAAAKACSLSGEKLRFSAVTCSACIEEPGYFATDPVVDFAVADCRELLNLLNEEKEALQLANGNDGRRPTA